MDQVPIRDFSDDLARYLNVLNACVLKTVNGLTKGMSEGWVCAAAIPASIATNVARASNGTGENLSCSLWSSRPEDGIHNQTSSHSKIQRVGTTHHRDTNDLLAK